MDGVKVEPSSQELTVMFVDVVGFSLSAERMDAPTVFRRLRELLLEMTTIVHEHGGIIDKVLGDGFLAFFGYSLDDQPPDASHVDAAVGCAIELQRHALRRALSTPEGKPVYPLRIGLNTSPVFIGDVGGAERVEYTLIGHGVNIAQRLEFACETFRIMVAEETLQGWKSYQGGSLRIDKKWVQTKHREELFEAYEINPFEGEENQVRNAMKTFREHAGLERKEGREPVDGGGIPVAVHADRVDGRILNFSHSGFALETATYFGKGAHIRISFAPTRKNVAEELAKTNVPFPLNCEVRWGAGSGDRYMHGLQLQDLSSEQKDNLLRFLRRYSSLIKVKRKSA